MEAFNMWTFMFGAPKIVCLETILEVSKTLVLNTISLQTNVLEAPL